jgi:hypothetical protein
MNIRNQYNEIWKPYRKESQNWRKDYKYEVSNYGRVRRVMPNGEYKLIKQLYTGGFPVVMGIRCEDKKQRSFYVHHAVAELFLPPKTEDQYRIVHLDFDKANNVFTNLKYVNKEEWWAHQNKNPKVIAAKKRRTYSKLNEAKVAIIKRKIFDPNRKTRMKMIAKQYGISEMQLYRIKTGENWGHVKPAEK